jgi:magnesium chelatase subunit D
MGKIKTKPKTRATPSRNSLTDEAVSLPPYPFAAIVGQDEMKLGLILNVVDPLIGGVLIMGHRGTAKSTAVRALADLLPEIQVVADCPYRCDPKDRRRLCSECNQKISSGMKLSPVASEVSVVELPLGATEDRVCGTIDIERALAAGRKSFAPGLLARANRGFLYIDEVNLLEDHLVDLLLDVAASGRNKVEREGVSVEHPSAFVLIGSGNPEEGELRPQLLDRFGLHVEVATEGYLIHRVAIVERRDEYDRGPEAFCALFEAEQDRLRQRITRARNSVDKVQVERALLTKIAQLCADLHVDGHRGELTIMRAARALAAFEARRLVTEDDVRSVAAMALRHRLRRDALEETPTSERIDQATEEVFAKAPRVRPPVNGSEQSKTRALPDGRGQPADDSVSAGSRGQGLNNTAEVRSPPAVDHKSSQSHLDAELRKPQRSNKSHAQSRNSGAKASSSQRRGRYARSVSTRTVDARIALDATLRALMVNEISVSRSLTPVDASSLRYKVLNHKQGTLYVFAIDTSGSMAANRIARAKSSILKLLRQSYLKRDCVAIISFHGTSANVDLPPSRSILRARRVLDSLNMGGSTPLSAGLVSAIDLVKRVKDKHGEVVLLLFTDGHSNVALRRNGTPVPRRKAIESELAALSVVLKKTRARVLVVDSQRQFESSEETRRLAELLQARFVKLPEIRVVIPGRQILT